MKEEYKFDFEELKVYQKAMEFVDKLFNISKNFSNRIQSSLGYQLRRAGLSICNNIEGSGKKSKNAKRQFYAYSLESARECISINNYSGLETK